MTPGQLHALLDQHRVAVNGSGSRGAPERGTDLDLAKLGRLTGGAS